MYFFLGGLIAYLSWGLTLEMTILSLSLFLAYLLLEKRWYLFLFVLGYYLVGSRGLFFGVEHYYNNLFYAFLSWGGVALLSSLSWVLIWSKSFQKRVYLLPIVILIVTLPPIGFISWLNPLPTIAILFPKFGFLGLIFEFLLIYLLLFAWKGYQLKNYRNIVITLFSILSLFSVKLFFPQNIQVDSNLTVINSSIKYSPITFDKSEEYKRIKKFFYLVQHNNKSNLLLPENALGNYSDLQSMIWSYLDKNKTIFAGANIYNFRYTKNSNVLMRLDYNSSKIVYKQRVPVPIEMWKPFTNSGTEATIYNQPIVFIDGIKSGVFICYEQLLAYPYLQTFFYHPDMIIGISNLYWAKNTNIREIQEETMQLWSLLFDVPMKFSVNL